ncbi:MAG: hypothetical protein WAT39_00105 [Planctomycetota bacterium]
MNRRDFFGAMAGLPAIAALPKVTEPSWPYRNPAIEGGQTPVETSAPDTLWTIDRITLNADFTYDVRVRGDEWRVAGVQATFHFTAPPAHSEWLDERMRLGSRLTCMEIQRGPQ